VIDALVENGKAKDKKIAELETKLNKFGESLQSIKEMEKELKELRESNAVVYYMDEKGKEELRKLVRQEIERRMH
jgi:aspartate/methionine/tyrosine aminotransferase